MIPRYLTTNCDSAQVDSPISKALLGSVEKPEKKTMSRAKRRPLMCLLILANLIVFNAAYGLYAAEEGTPIWKVVLRDNVVCTVWQMCPVSGLNNSKGVVTGILCNDNNPTVLIDNELVHEGEFIHGVEVVRVEPRQVHFRKNDVEWTQQVGGNPHRMW